LKAERLREYLLCLHQTLLHTDAGDIVNPSQWLTGRQVWEDDSGTVGSAALELHQGSWKRNSGILL